ncbi:M13 family metallopeptidase [Sphingomonas psychrotolerans]|uniref:M13 family metallopeptidase n=1 Tax=Sphingomonas psychrotolerans TaxID=1327635 RepID=A0ABU3MZ60_9SPHN|nr:M13 family metallopeptidase [Sphingomonas psychrotolerans]MDT8757573.1 M13 family metallopeptidase [Sphingomonas psychrotolerans]
MTTRAALFALLLATAACTPGGGTVGNGAAEAGAGIGVDVVGLNKQVKPGDDFDEYANGGWRAKTEIPADRSSTGAFFEVFNKAEANNAAIVQAALKANAAPGTDQRRIADWYNAYTDTAAIDARGLAPLSAEMDAITALKDKKALSTMLGANIRADVDPLNATNFETSNLFGLFISQALDRPDTNVPYLLQGGLGLPERDYYLSDKPEMATIRDQYRAYIGKLLSLANITEPDARAQRVFELESKIARAHTDIVTSQDIHKANNPWKKADFARKAPGIDWDAFWNAAGLGGQQDFIVWHPQTVAAMAKLVASEPLQAWQDWLTFHRIDEVSEVLPTAFDQAHFEFYSHTLNGQPRPRPRDKRAIGSVNAWLGDAVGQLYVKDYFPASSRADIQNMVKGILAAFDKRVAALPWMAPATKAEARKKIAGMRVGIGYPDTWRSYADLEVKADDPVGNLRRAQLFEYRHQLAKIGKPVDRGEWWMTPQTVNAVNLPLQNALNFPAAILQAPFYDPGADAAANYGAIGAVIGHEISHGFDDLGANFDASGRLRNWWTPEDLARFKASGKALAAQYDAYEALPGLHLKGQQTLSENIADVAGLTAAYEAYRASLGGKEPPVIGGLTGDQRFFLAYAQAWRDKSREQALRARIATDAHAPARWRAQTVRNLDAWYPAFGVQAGQKLFLTPEQRVKVW